MSGASGGARSGDIENGYGRSNENRRGSAKLINGPRLACSFAGALLTHTRKIDIDLQILRESSETRTRQQWRALAVGGLPVESPVGRPDF